MLSSNISGVFRVATCRLYSFTRFLPSNTHLPRSPWISHAHLLASAHVTPSVTYRRALTFPYFSTTASAPKPPPAAAVKNAVEEENQSLTDVILDNAGKLFLLTLFSIVAAIVRSAQGTNDRTANRDAVESAASLDPIEIDDLRRANPAFDDAAFAAVLRAAIHAFPDGGAPPSYPAFAATAMGTGMRLELGHLLDRAVLASGRGWEEGGEVRYTTTVLLTALALAVHGSVSPARRLQMLFTACRAIQDGDLPSLEDAGTISVGMLIELVGCLQATSQLPADTQIVETDTKYPVQRHRQGTPEELVKMAQDFVRREGEPDIDRVGWEAFAAVLKSQYVCVWGECYLPKKRNVQGE